MESDKKLLTIEHVMHDFVYGPGGAATIAGSCEILLFHPFDTIAKRLMSHHQRVIDSESISQTMRNINSVIFKGMKEASVNQTSNHKASFFDVVKHMYPGSTYAVAYKVLQRVVKFAGQPYVSDYLHRHCGKIFLTTNSVTGEFNKHGKGAMMIEATAGSMVGVMELSLLPFDRMKVLNQTNKVALKHRNMLSVLRSEGIRKLYAGAVTTGVRNVTGSFLLFGGTAFTKEYLYKLKNYKDATVTQNIIASTIGGCIGVLCTSPMDVVKTRVQSQHFDKHVSGWRIFIHTIRTEGFSAFYKGITPKLITSAPRLVFSYTVTQQLIKVLRKENRD